MNVWMLLAMIFFSFFVGINYLIWPEKIRTWAGIRDDRKSDRRVSFMFSRRYLLCVRAGGLLGIVMGFAIIWAGFISS